MWNSSEKRKVEDIDTPIDALTRKIRKANFCAQSAKRLIRVIKTLKGNKEPLSTYGTAKLLGVSWYNRRKDGEFPVRTKEGLSGREIITLFYSKIKGQEKFPERKFLCPISDKVANSGEKK